MKQEPDTIALPETEPEPEPKLKKHHKKLKIAGIVALALLFIGLAAYSTTSFFKTKDLSNQLSQQQDKVAAAEAKTKKLSEENKKMQAAAKAKPKTTEKTAAAKAVEKTPAPVAENTTDGNFVALTPHGGMMAHENKTVFEFTPHKQANKYVVEIKMMGQQTYPTSYPNDQTVVFATGATQPERIRLTKILESGDYNWRVTAISTTGGTDKVLQSSEDRTYQISR